MEKYKSYFRPAVDAMSGYTPGEQPVIQNLIKLNTNENPYPPSPEVQKMFNTCDSSRLRLYPNPTGDMLRDRIADIYGFKRENIILGNGSDDILTMTFRSFTDSERAVAFVDPTYSLYPVLSEIQGSKTIQIALNEDFSLPDDLEQQAAAANLFILTRPNAPTGNSFPLERVKQFCRNFKGMVMVDEAYADFASDNCLELVNEFPNVMICRTLSKSCSAAGVRLGYAIAHPQTIEGLMKVRDSYNVSMLTQMTADAILADTAYINSCLEKVRDTRARLSSKLREIGFKVIPSEANFIFASPPDEDGESCAAFLREQAVLVRYFPGEVTGKYIRISIGTDAQIDRLITLVTEKYT